MREKQEPSLRRYSCFHLFVQFFGTQTVPGERSERRVIHTAESELQRM
jgi:hypothetical protein